MRYVIALDVGGTKIEAALFDEKYHALRKERVPSPVNMSRKATLSTITSLIDRLKDRKISGIGISYPANILAGGRTPKVSKLRGLAGFDLQGYLSKKFGCKVVVANDADCFALGEHRMGAAKGTTNSFGLIWGTGVGGGAVIHGELYVAKTMSAGELGHDVLDGKGPRNEFGQRGDIESYAGGVYLARNYRKLGGRIKAAGAREIFYSKEPAAKKAMSMALDSIARGLSHVMHLLCPEIIVVGGGLSNLPIYSKLNCLTKKYTSRNMRGQVHIVRNRLGDSSGVYGAAALVL
jgi:fructokinase